MILIDEICYMSPEVGLAIDALLRERQEEALANAKCYNLCRDIVINDIIANEFEIRMPPGRDFSGWLEPVVIQQKNQKPGDCHKQKRGKRKRKW
jgi:hypothetical protein